MIDSTQLPHSMVAGADEGVVVNPFASGLRNPVKAAATHFGRCRNFHIRHDLWLALAGGYETKVDFRFEEMRDALWPFDDIAIVLRGSPWRSFNDNPSEKYRQKRIGFAKKTTNEDCFVVQCLDEMETSKPGYPAVIDVSHTAFSRYGMGRPMFLDQLAKGHGYEVSVESDRLRVRGTFWFFRAFAVFCDMLKFCGSLVDVRHTLRGKHKRTTLDMVKKQDYRDIEIVLRPNVTVREVQLRVEAGIAGYERAHPRRHDVREHIRTLSDGRIIIVSAHERGGKSGPGPAYNCGPISLWYASQKSLNCHVEAS